MDIQLILALFPNKLLILLHKFYKKNWITKENENMIYLFYNPAFENIWLEFEDDNCRIWLVKTIDKLLKSLS